MSTQTAPTKAPPATDGPHYDNPASKPIAGPRGVTDRTDVQRFTWKLFFVLILCVVALGVVLSLVSRHV